MLSAEAEERSASADVDQAALDLSYCTVTAPIDGRIGEAKVKVGNLVGPLTGGSSGDYTELATIQQLDPMGVDMQCSSRYLERATLLINQGLDVQLVRPGAEGEGLHPHLGRCLFIDNRIDPTTSTVLIRASVPNPDQTLLPGDYVKLNMTVGTLDDVVLIPERAMIETQAGSTVYVVDDDNTVRVARVVTNYVTNGLQVIEEGLKPGERVIVEGIQLVRPGQAVNPQEAAWPDPASSSPTRSEGLRGLRPRPRPSEEAPSDQVQPASQPDAVDCTEAVNPGDG